MTHSQLAAALIAAPFLTLALVWLVVETIRIRAEEKARVKARARKQRPF